MIKQDEAEQKMKFSHFTADDYKKDRERICKSTNQNQSSGVIKLIFICIKFDMFCN